MDSQAFIDAGKRAFGKSGWKSQVADALGVDRTTVWRYISGVRPIPESIAVAMEALQNRSRVS